MSWSGAGMPNACAFLYQIRPEWIYHQRSLNGDWDTWNSVEAHYQLRQFLSGTVYRVNSINNPTTYLIEALWSKCLFNISFKWSLKYEALSVFSSVFEFQCYYVCRNLTSYLLHGVKGSAVCDRRRHPSASSIWTLARVDSRLQAPPLPLYIAVQFRAVMWWPIKKFGIWYTPSSR